jgi:hypothetical protein
MFWRDWSFSFHSFPFAGGLRLLLSSGSSKLVIGDLVPRNWGGLEQASTVRLILAIVYLGSPYPSLPDRSSPIAGMSKTVVSAGDICSRVSSRYRVSGRVIGVGSWGSSRSAAREDLEDPEFGRGALFASQPRQGEESSRESDVSEALEYFLTTLPTGKRVVGLDS